MPGETDIPQYPPTDTADEPPAELMPGVCDGTIDTRMPVDGDPPDAPPEAPDLETLYRQYCHELGQLAFLLTTDRAEAEDVVVDVFVTLAERYDLRTLDNPLAFLRAAVANRSRSVLRHRSVVERHAPKPPPDAPSAEHDALEILERQKVIEAIRRLPPRQREAIVLRYYLDLSEREIAETMGVRPGSVKGHTSRGIVTLRKILIDDGVGS